MKIGQDHRAKQVNIRSELASNQGHSQVELGQIIRQNTRIAREEGSKRWNFLMKTNALWWTPTHLIGRMRKGSYSPRGHSRPLLKTSIPFCEPLSEPLFTVKPVASPLPRTLLRALPQNPPRNIIRTLLRNVWCCTTP